MHRAIGHSINGLGVLDGVGTLLFLVPTIGLASAGAYDLDEDAIHFTLICDEEIEPHLAERKEVIIKEEPKIYEESQRVY